MFTKCAGIVIASVWIFVANFPQKQGARIKQNNWWYAYINDYLRRVGILHLLCRDLIQVRSLKWVINKQNTQDTEIIGVSRTYDIKNQIVEFDAYLSRFGIWSVLCRDLVLLIVVLEGFSVKNLDTNWDSNIILFCQNSVKVPVDINWVGKGCHVSFPATC